MDPTVDLFKARFPEFRGVEDAFIQLLLNEASLDVGQRWVNPEFRALAVLHLTAHLLSLSGNGAAGAGGGAGLATGTIKRRRVGDVEVEYETGGAASSGSLLPSTRYGQRYLELLGQNFGPAVLVV